MRRFLLAAAFALAAIDTIQAQEPLMDILRGELDYSFERLAEADSPPYYIDFRVTETRRHAVSAQMGVVTGASDTHERVFKPQIRLGTAEFDNFREAMGGGRYDGAVALPLGDGSEDAIRQAVWEQVRAEHRASEMNLERIRADEHLISERDDRAPDWSAAPVAEYYEAPLTEGQRAFDAEDLARRVKAYSAVFLDSPQILSGTASIDFTVQRRVFLSSEGAAVAQNSRACRLMVQAMVRTDDGMDLPLYRSWFAFTPGGLPGDDEVLAGVRELAATLVAMASAPVVTPYTGPALLSGEAAGVFFHEIFGHRIEGQRMKSDQDGQTFKKMVGGSVLPRHFSVYDDPSLSSFGGEDLYGHYLYDDQGVRGRRTDVVEGGVLKGFLMTRTPTDEFGESNGHARAEAGMDPVSRQSNLVIETSRHLTDEQLRKALVREARAQRREFGLYFKEVTGGFTMTGRYSPNSFNVTPLEVYKIYVDGRPDELVRGVDLIGTPLSMFAGIIEAGGATEIFTGVCGAESGSVPVTAISPAVLVSKVEVQRKAKSSDTPPILPRPTAGGGEPGDEQIFGAMEAEMARGMEGLSMADAPRPMWTGYLYSRVRAMAVSASLGGVVSSRLQPQRFSGVRMLLGDEMATSDLQYNGGYNIRGAAVESDPGQIRREFWTGSDAAYKQAAADLVRKTAIRRTGSRPAGEENLADHRPVRAITREVESPAFEFDRQGWERRAGELSAIFEGHPSLYGSQVRMAAYDWTNYTLTSEGVRTRQPASWATVAVTASVRTDDGEERSDGVDIYAVSDGELPSFDELAAVTEQFAGRLAAYATAPRFDEFYSGPVLFTGQAAFRMLDDNLLRNDGNGLLVRRRAESGYNAPAPGRLENRIGQRVTDRALTIVNHSAMREWNGVPLMGRYEIDADGIVPPDSLVLVDEGMLAATLNGNIPTLRTPLSTGSNRFGASINPIVAPGTLEIRAWGGVPIAELEKRLLELADADGLTHAYIVERMAGVNIVWRVDVATGSRELVRGAEVQPVEMAQLKRLAGVASERAVRNYLAGQVPATMIYPAAVLLEDVEIGAEESTGEKPSPVVNPLERN